MAAVTAAVSFTMIYFSNDCQPLGSEHNEDYPLQVDTHTFNKFHLLQQSKVKLNSLLLTFLSFVSSQFNTSRQMVTHVCVL